MNIRVLIIGFGKMGKNYSKYLEGFGVEWLYYDPFVEGGLTELSNLNNYSHIIISTPSEKHHESYKKVFDLKFNGSVYIDKPVVVLDEYLNILDNKNVFCGMTERYNPAILKVKELLDLESLISLRFTRYSTVPSNIKTSVLFDLGIHDLDLYFYLLDLKVIPKEYNIFKTSKTCCVSIKENDILSTFEWSHESNKRERKLVILQKNIVYEADLIDQTVLAYEQDCVIRNLYIDKTQVLREVMCEFLNGYKCDATLSHKLMFDIINN